MNYNFWNILGGFSFLYIIGYSLIFALTFMYFKFALKKKVAVKNLWLNVAILDFFWLLGVVLAVMFGSNYGLPIFAFVSIASIFGLIYLVVEKTIGFKGKDKMFYSLLLSGIINPIWYFILRIAWI